MRHYYAEFCPRGIDTMTEFDQLCKFDNRQNRDRFVKYINEISEPYGCFMAEAVTLKSRAHRYPARSANAEWIEAGENEFRHLAIYQRSDYVL